MAKPFTVKKREDLPDLEVTLEVEIPWESAAKKREAAVRELAEMGTFDGFRPGAAPEAIVVAKFGEKALREAMGFHAIRAVFPEILASEKIAPLVEPQLTVTALKEGEPVTFTARVTLLPRVTLPDHKSIAKSVERREVKPSDAEIDAEVERVRRAVAAKGHSHEHGEDCHDCEAPAADAPLAPLTDEEASKVGPFATAAELRAKVGELLADANGYRERDRRRRAIVEKIIAEAKPEIPKIVIDREVDRMRAEFEQSIERVGLSWEKYLAQVDRTEESLREEWRPEARIRAASHLILPMIAREENLVVNDALVDRETDALVAKAPGASRADARAYVEHLVRNDLVLAFLEDLDRREAKKAE
jgi:FKBP-type peptidyl-prolyl cis-trans isomerase (trigger factor)